MSLFDHLTLTRPLAVPDLETTGLSTEKDRIVEVGLEIHYPPNSCSLCLGARFDAPEGPACVRCNGTGREPTLTWGTIVNPGIPIKKNVHGITDEKLKTCRVCSELPGHRDHVTTSDSECHPFKPWPTFAQLASRLARVLTNVDFAGKNVRFDLGFLEAEFTRTKIAWSYKDAAIIDADAIERLKEPRDLSSLYRRRTGKEPVDAHRATADVAMTVEIIAAQFALWPDLPRTPAELHALLWADQIDGENKFRFVDGVPAVWFGKHRGTAMTEVPVDYWDWVIRGAFSNEVKGIAAKAKLGEFPVKKEQP